MPRGRIVPASFGPVVTPGASGNDGGLVLPAKIVEAAYTASGLAAWPDMDIDGETPLIVYHGGDAGGATWIPHKGSISNDAGKIGSGSSSSASPYSPSDGCATSSGGGYYQSSGGAGGVGSTGDLVRLLIATVGSSGDLALDTRDATGTGMYLYVNATPAYQPGIGQAGTWASPVIDPAVPLGQWHGWVELIDRSESDGFWGLVNGELEVAKADPTAVVNISDANAEMTLLSDYVGSGNWAGRFYVMAIWEATGWLDSSDTPLMYKVAFEALHSIAGLRSGTVPASCGRCPQVTRSTARYFTSGDGAELAQKHLSIIQEFNGSSGWQIAPARTHQVTYSQAVIGWSSSNLTTLTAGGFVGNTNDTTHEAYENAGTSINAGSQYCMYAVIDPAQNLDWVKLTADGESCYFDVRNVAAGTGTSNIRDSGAFEDANGYVHCWATWIAQSTGATTFGIAGAQSDSDSTYAGGSSGLDVMWLDAGFCEETYAGFYRTGASSVSLSDEVVTLPAAELTFAGSPTSAFSFGLDLMMLGRPAGDRCVWSFSNAGLSSNCVELYLTTDGYLKLIVTSSYGNNGEVVGSVNVCDGAFRSIVCSVDANDLRLYCNASLLGADTSVALPALTKHNLGSRYDGTLGAGAVVRNRWIAEDAVAA